MRKRLFSLFMSLIMVISLAAVMPAVTVGAENYDVETFVWGNYKCEKNWGETITIVKYLAHETSITIPNEIDGLPVTAIGDHAFNNTIVTQEVEFPNTLKYIGEGAFEDNWTLREVILPDSVTCIDKYAFKNCTALKILKLPNDYCDIRFGAFDNCRNIKELNVGDADYYNCHEFDDFLDSYFRYKLPSDCLIICNYYRPSIQNKYAYQYAQENGYKYEFANVINNFAYKKLENYYDEITDKYIYNGECEITGYVGSESEIVVPSYLNDMKVTEVDYLNDTVKKVTFPNTLNTLSNFGQNVNTVVLSSNVSCYWLHFNNLSYAEGVTKIGYDEEVGAQRFLPSEVKSVTLPYSLKIIGYSTFFSCENLKSITIPNGVTTIGGIAFAYTGIENIKIPNSVTSIGKGAFERCENLKSVELPNNIKTIQMSTFNCCWSLETITIPKSVTSIETGAFFGCEELEVYYSGTKNQWKSISISSDYNFALESSTIHCSDGDIVPHTHNYTSKITKQPTCTATGIKTFSCSCGDKYTQTIAKTAHKYTTTIVKPTYAAQGYTLHKCSVCGTRYKDNYKAKLTLGNITKVNFTSSSNAVKMSWNKVSGATGYRVYQYNTSTKKWKAVANIKNTNYTFKNLKSGTTYKFTVRAYKNQGGKTYLSPKYTTFTSSTNPATVNFKLTAGSKKATVKWSKVTGATGYKVYYKTSKNGSWKLLKTANNKTTSYTKTGLTKGKTYYFTVKAYRTVGGKTYNGSYNTKSVKVK